MQVEFLCINPVNKSQISISQGISPQYIMAIPALSHITYNVLQ